MVTKVMLPRLSLTTVEGTVVKWLKQEGDAVQQHESLVEVLIDKVNNVLEAPEPGIVLKIIAPKGTVVLADSTLCWIGRPGETIPRDGELGSSSSEPHGGTEENQMAGPGKGYVVASPAAKRLAHRHGVDLRQVDGTGPGDMVLKDDVLRSIEAQARLQKVESGVETAIKASPLARNLATELKVDLASVVGTGPRGKITRDDVLAAAEIAARSDIGETTAVSGTAAPPRIPARVASTVPMVGLRRTIAQRMSLSSQTVARVTHTTEADVTESVKMREQMTSRSEAKHGVRISYTDIVVKIVAAALREHPMMNARLVENEIHMLDEINVGVAVAVPDGLVVPVVRDADRKDLVAIAREVREKVERARSGALTQEDSTGGTFTVTNLGSYEIDAFTPIVNLPEVGILGVGRIVEKPAIFEGEFARRSMMFLSLSFDHRVVDGAPAAEFLRSVKSLLENPYALFVPD